MHLLISLLMMCSLLVLIVAGLISVLRDMLHRDWRAAAPAGELDLDLPRDFDHPLRRQVEPVDDFRGVAVQKSE